MDLLECPLCLFLMCEPVTMSCGHTFCRRCVGSCLPSKCPTCKERLKQREVKSMKNNVLLISVAEKCCPQETKMKCHIQEKLKANEFLEALRASDEGINLGKAHSCTHNSLKFASCQIMMPAAIEEVMWSQRIHTRSQTTRLESEVLRTVHIPGRCPMMAQPVY